MNRLLDCERIIKENKLTIAAAESCTGGLVSSAFVSLAGSSEWFTEGCVTYTENAKMRRLNVPSEMIDKYSAVSFEVARSMAEGVRTTSGACIGISTTGYAGPTGGTASDPNGTVYFGYSDKHGTRSTKKHFLGDRNEVRIQAAAYMLEFLYDNLQNSV